MIKETGQFKRIGRLDFEKFKTEIQATSKVINYINKEGLLLASLIPEAWFFYEAMLFNHIDENEDWEPDKKFGQKFILIYNGITEKGKFSEEKSLINSGFKDKLKEEKVAIFYSAQPLKSLKDPENKKFVANYFVIKS